MSLKLATIKTPLPTDLHFLNRIKMRTMSKEEFIENHGSGTLRKNHRIGMDIDHHYLHERIAYEFGYGFESIDETRVTWGHAISFPDCKANTEVGWHVERYMNVLAFPGDEIEVKYLQVEYPDGVKREGLGMILRKTSAQFIPKRHIVFTIIAEYDPIKQEYNDAINPC